MIELLSRLDAGTSPYIGQMQDSGTTRLTEKQLADRKAAKNMRCQTCRGKKQVKEPAKQVGAEVEYVTCPRCFGSGLKLDGSQVSTASRAAPKTLSQDAIANAVLGMQPHWYRAAVVKVTHNTMLQSELAEDLRVELIMDHSQSWRLSEDLRQARMLGLSRVAVHNLVHGNYAKTNIGSLIMCCTGKSWRKTWADRAEFFTDRLEGWVVEADRYMREQVEQSRDEVESVA